MTQPTVGTELAVGIDIGSTSTKAVAADADGNVVARHRVPHPLVVREATLMEHDANRAWRRGPGLALAGLGHIDPVGVCVAAMVPSLCAVDHRGVPSSPGLLYGDSRSATGLSTASPVSGELGGMLAWAAAHHSRAGGYWPAQAVANHALSGEAVIDSGTAALAFPLFNGQGWDEGAAAAVGVTPTQLPRVVGTGQASGLLSRPGHQGGGTGSTSRPGTGTSRGSAGGLGARGEAVLASGLVDAMGEQMVAGADNDGDVLVICGTTVITWIITSRWLQVPGLWTIPHTTPSKVMIGGASGAGGLFLNWATGLLGRSGPATDPHRVPVWAPYPRGERTPLHDPDRRATLCGLDLTHDAGAARRAAFEASGFVVRHHIDCAGLPVRRLVATGGGVRVPEWTQALADCTGLPVDVAQVPEGGALGAAFVARMAAGQETSMADAARWARVDRQVEPDLAWVSPVAHRYAIFRELSGGPPS